MILIAHRGNTSGQNPKRENYPDYLMEAVKMGFDVETDVWLIDNKFYLGHDSPRYEIDSQFLKNNNFWCHAKNIDALFEMLSRDIHCFWHQNDKVTITSEGYMWTFPGEKLTKRSICVLPEASSYNKDDIQNCMGVCSDFIGSRRFIV